MKLYVILTIFLVLAAALSPFAVLSPSKGQPQTSTTLESVQTKTKITQKETEAKTIKVLRTGSGKVVEKEMFDYVKGAVSGEISPE